MRVKFVSCRGYSLVAGGGRTCSTLSPFKDDVSMKRMSGG